MATAAKTRAKEPFLVRWKKNYRVNKYIYLMLVPVVLFYVIFHYIPMGGAVIAFQDYRPARGIMGSTWVGLDHFRDFLGGPFAWRLIRNTLLINVYAIAFGFPAPILLALMINEIRAKHFKKTMQTISYMPHFISLVVVSGLLLDFSRTTGLFNDIIAFFGGARTSLFARAELFRMLFTVSGIWQTIGWGSIIYLATLSTVDPNLHEAAAIDGASRFKRMIHVSFPALVPVIIIQFILRVGFILHQGFERVFLLYSPIIFETADVIATFVYRRGLLDMNFSFGAAVGIFNSAVNLVVLFIANYVCRRVFKESLW